MSRVEMCDWRWFGSPGHFIGAKYCKFHLCTQVGDWLVSTVGEYQPLEDSRYPGEDIGAGRKYETMVFGSTGDSCDDPECGCGMPFHNGRELDFSGYNTAGDAMKGHLAMCNVWAEKSKDEEAELW